MDEKILAIPWIMLTGLPRMAHLLCQEWLQAGWLEMTDPSRRKRAYRLSAIHRQ